MLGSSKAKEIDLVFDKNSFRAGDEVLVKVNPASGYKAVMLLYVFPFVLMMLALFLVANAGYSEGIAGLASLFVLLPYFFMIYLFKKSLAGQCNFEVVKR
jgi:positive regulator of sigma E activity